MSISSSRMRNPLFILEETRRASTAFLVLVFGFDCDFEVEVEVGEIEILFLSSSFIVNEALTDQTSSPIGESISPSSSTFLGSSSKHIWTASFGPVSVSGQSVQTKKYKVSS